MKHHIKNKSFDIIQLNKQREIDNKTYTFYNSTKPFDHKDFIERVKESQEQVWPEIKKELQKLTVQFVSHQLTDSFFIPSQLQGNKLKWSELFLKQKKVQGLFADFKFGIESALKQELKYNKEQLQQYLAVPSKFMNEAELKQMYDQKVKYLDNIPAVIKKRDKTFIESVKKKILEDDDAHKLYERILNDPANPQFTQKLEGIKNLHQTFHEQDEFKKMISQAKEKLRLLKDISNQFEDNNQDLSNGIERFLEESKIPAISKRKPGEKLSILLDKWDNEIDGKIWSQDDLEIFSVTIPNQFIKFLLQSELWLSVEKYEKELRQELKGFQMDKQCIVSFHEKKYNELEQKTSFIIAAQESAIIETKLQFGQKMEQALMKVADFESQIFNSQVEDDHIQRQIDYYERIDIQSVEEGRERLNTCTKLIKVLKKMHDTEKQSHQKELQKRIEMEKLRDEFYTQVMIYHELFQNVSGNLLKLIVNLDVLDEKSGEELQQLIFKNDVQIRYNEEHLYKIVDKIALLEIDDCIDVAIAYRKSAESRDNRVYALLTDLKNIATNPSQNIMNDQQVRSIKNLVEQFQKQEEKKQLIAQIEQQQEQQKAVEKNEKNEKIKSSDTVKKSNKPLKKIPDRTSKIPFFKNPKRLKQFQIEIDKMGKTQVAKDDILYVVSQLKEIPDFCEYFEGLDWNSIINLDQMTNVLQYKFKTLIEDQKSIKTLDIVSIDEFGIFFNTMPLKILMLRGDKQEVVNHMSRILLIKRLLTQSENLSLFTKKVNNEAQTNDEIHYQFAQQELDDGFEDAISDLNEDLQSQQHLANLKEINLGSEGFDDYAKRVLDYINVKCYEAVENSKLQTPVEGKPFKNTKNIKKATTLSLKLKKRSSQASPTFETKRKAGSLKKQPLLPSPQDKNFLKIHLSSAEDLNISGEEIAEIKENTSNSDSNSDISLKSSEKRNKYRQQEYEKEMAIKVQNELQEFDSENIIKIQVKDRKFNNLKESYHQPSQYNSQVMKKNQEQKLKEKRSARRRNKMVDAEMNTEMRHKDLDLMMNLKNEANKTIQTLQHFIEKQEKIIQDQYLYNSDFSSNNQISSRNNLTSAPVGGSRRNKSKNIPQTHPTIQVQDSQQPINKNFYTFQSDQTNDTEQLDDLVIWKSNAFPQRGVDKFCPNSARNLKFRSNRRQVFSKNQTSNANIQNVTESGCAPLVGGNMQNNDPSLLTSSLKLEVSNIKTQTFMKRLKLQTNISSRQEIIEDAKLKSLKFSNMSSQSYLNKMKHAIGVSFANSPIREVSGNQRYEIKINSEYEKIDAPQGNNDNSFSQNNQQFPLSAHQQKRPHHSLTNSVSIERNSNNNGLQKFLGNIINSQNSFS